MTTSLSQQLQRLAVPQTAQLTDSRKRVSILFDPKEAANKDRRTIYELGISGLRELISINSKFTQFESTLFDEYSLNVERSVENKEVNELLNRNIKKFLQHLSPYFLLRPAHLCLEWLLRRFQIHNYNRAELMALALPYHETNIFVRVMQTFNLNQRDDEWDWLRPLQKPGLPLPKATIINRASADAAFYKFICQTTLSAVKEFGAEAGQLQVQISFYTSVVVGALEIAPMISEWHITNMLESLLYAFQSNVVDVTAAGYIIASQLVSKTQLKSKLCLALVERISNVNFNQLLPVALMTLILIFDRQTSAPSSLTTKALKNLLKQKWLVSVLADLSKDNIDIHALCSPIMRDCVKIIEAGDAEGAECKRLLGQLLSDMEMSPSTARKFISCILDSYVKSKPNSVAPLKHGDIIEVDESDEEGDVPMGAEKVEFEAWYSDYLRALERKYPLAFDATIKESLGTKKQGNENRSAAIKMALGFRLKFSGENQSDIYESLYHYTAKIRLLAVQTLMEKSNDFHNRVQNYQLLKECLADRLMDDSLAVQAEVLKLPTKDFIDIMGCGHFASCIIEILCRLRQNNEMTTKMEQVENQLVEHLLSAAIIENYDVNIVLMAVMPLLFPNANQTSNALINYKAVETLLNSALCDKIAFIRQLKKVLSKNGKIEKEVTTSDMRKLFLDTITSAKQSLSISELFESIERQGGEKYFKQPMQLTNLLLLTNASCRQELTPNECWLILQKLQRYTKRFEISANVDWAREVPMQLYTDFLLSLMRYTKFNAETMVNWEHGGDDSETTLRCVLSVFSLMASKAFSTSQKSEDEILSWSLVLKEYFVEVFETAQRKVEFLLNFYVNPESRFFANYELHRMYAYKILKSILMNSANDVNLSMEHIMKITLGLIAGSETLRAECLETLQIVSQRENVDNAVKSFARCILNRRTEITMDEHQYPLALYNVVVSKQKDTKKRLMVTKVLNGIKLLLKDPGVALSRPTLTLQLLRITEHLNDADVIADLMPLAMASLEHTENCILIEPYSHILQLVCQRFMPENMATCIKHSSHTWRLFEAVFDKHNTYIIDSDELKMQPLPCLVMEIINQHVYENLPEAYKTKYIKLILRSIGNSDNNTIFLSANKLMKKCQIDCEPLTSILQDMFKDDDASFKPKKGKSTGKGPKVVNIPWNSKVNTVSWKQGIALLELLEDKKLPLSLDKMVTPLFALLSFCLLDAEANASVEYTKQLALSLLLNCCQYFKANLGRAEVQKSLTQTTFRIDPIVECLRETPNPQTHQRALALLTQCADLFPQPVLHNIVKIFTFMGSSVVRQDDAYSFLIIDNIIQSIVPILVRGSVADGNDAKQSVIPVLKVFSDIIFDVPEHRRLSLYTKLMKTLGADKYLWIFLCILFESHVMHDEKQKLAQKKARKDEKAAPQLSETQGNRMDAALKLMEAFEPQTTLETCIQLLAYLKTQPTTKAVDKTQAAPKKSTQQGIEAAEASLFDVQSHSAKQLRHYKYVIMQFLSSASSAPEFLRKLAMLSDEEHQSFKPFFQNFIIRILSYLPVVNAAIDGASDEVERKFWKIILINVQDTLDNAMALLSPEIFIIVVNGLMQHQLLSIRRKAIELLSARLQKEGAEIYKTCADDTFKQLIQTLGDIVNTIFEEEMQTESPTSSAHERIVLQQSALIAVKHLSKHFALKYVEEFKALLKTITKIAKDSVNLSKILLASVVLAIVEVACNLKAHSLSRLPKFMPRLIYVLQQQAEVVKRQPPDHVCIAIITGMQKLFESLPLFLGPHVVDVLTALSSMAAHIYNQSSDKHQNSVVALQKIEAIWQRIAASVPLRILVPSCEKSYRTLMAEERYRDISILMNLLKEALKRAENADLNSEQTDLCNFCLHSLEFRLAMQGNTTLGVEEIADIESSILEAFVAWTLKLSESAFRPLYEKVYDWAFKTNPTKSTQITFFVFSVKISKELKAIFTLFSGVFLEDAARLLKECLSLVAEEEPADRMQIDSDPLDVELVKGILGVLHNIFLYAGKKFVSTRRFELLMQPVVDQMENRMILEDESMQSMLISCISQFAVAVSSDIMWKQLNYQVLMKTRSNVAEVRILATNCFVEVARKLGEEFSTLLPETVPFIAELFEDENSRVEKNTRKAVQELESILGESLQKYL